jgi:hypothetical protein
MAHEYVVAGTYRYVGNDANNIVSPNIVIPSLAEAVPVDADLTVQEVNDVQFPPPG